MNRRALTAMALLGFAIATVLPQIGFAQTNSLLNSLVGTWKLNLAKSTFSPGPAPRSQTLSIQAEGQGFRLTFDTVDAQGNSTKRTNVDFDDGKSHPVTGVPAYDAISLKTVNDSTIWVLRIKAGKVVQTIVLVVSADGKSHTATVTGVTADGRALNDTVVYDKQ